jgi:hypothetical protein
MTGYPGPFAEITADPAVQIDVDIRYAAAGNCSVIQSAPNGGSSIVLEDHESISPLTSRSPRHLGKARGDRAGRS